MLCTTNSNHSGKLAAKGERNEIKITAFLLRFKFEIKPNTFRFLDHTSIHNCSDFYRQLLTLDKGEISPDNGENMTASLPRKKSSVQKKGGIKIRQRLPPQGKKRRTSSERLALPLERGTARQAPAIKSLAVTTQEAAKPRRRQRGGQRAA